MSPIDFLRGVFVRRDRKPQVADATADNIISASGASACPAHFQGVVGVDAIRVSSAGTTRFSVDGNGCSIFAGTMKLTYNAVSGAVGAVSASNGRIVFGFDTSGGAGSLTLPAISALAGSGCVYIVMDSSGNANTNNITVTANAADTINGTGSGGNKVISAQYGAILFIAGAATKWRAYTLTPA